MQKEQSEKAIKMNKKRKQTAKTITIIKATVIVFIIVGIKQNMNYKEL